ncbi:glucan endo-1,3-beta-glucosidase 7-like [Silene latifolia]|uniref:glucan endo-1,3-beta-glucosidase 7-like n=1 Tax=Silene latifolia TaxID=37657 RepID=UPI003D78222A
MANHAITLSFALLFLLQAFHLSRSQPYIGINYGIVADNLPPPSASAKLLQSTSIQKVRLYGADPTIIKALANTNIGIVIGVANGDIPGIASDPSTAKGWINSNVSPYYPASNIIIIAVGNEVMLSGDENLMTSLLPAMKNLQSALGEAGADKIKVSTVHAMAVLAQSDPPSAGSFNPSYGDVMTTLLAFLKSTGSPFMINPYPYFAYQSDPRPDTLAFCLFQPNAGRVDSGTKINYMNMFDAQVDAVHSALDKAGFKGVEIVVAETGWPYKGDDNEVGPSLENAKAYNGNLVKHLKSMVGTPLMPGKSVDTYLFALYDEDLKPGPTSERSFGLFKPDLTMTYDVGLSGSSSAAQAPTNVAASPTTSAVTPTSSPFGLAPSTTTTPTIATPNATSPVTAVNPTGVATGFAADSPPNHGHTHAPSNDAISLRKHVTCGSILVAFTSTLMFL